MATTPRPRRRQHFPSELQERTAENGLGGSSGFNGSFALARESVRHDHQSSLGSTSKLSRAPRNDPLDRPDPSNPYDSFVLDVCPVTEAGGDFTIPSDLSAPRS